MHSFYEYELIPIKKINEILICLKTKRPNYREQVFVLVYLLRYGWRCRLYAETRGYSTVLY